MSIEFCDKKKLFHLKTPNSSYFIQIVKDKYPVHCGWYGSINQWKGSRSVQYFDRSFSPNPDSNERSFSLDSIPLEYSAWGRSDLRPPSLHVMQSDGSSSLDLFYKDYRIEKGKPGLSGLPSVYTEDESEADTLSIVMEDPLTELQCELVYSVFNQYDVISRNVRLINKGKESLDIRNIMSLNLDLDSSRYRMLQLSGAHNRERHIYTRELSPGTQSIDSRRGASSHQQNPFLALLEQNADENSGVAYGFNLVYSGNFVASVHVDQFDSTRVQMGINPFDFQWKLDPGAYFQTPETIMVRSTKGLGEMSRIYHQLYRTRLVRGKYKRKERPILINNWEATYFDFDSDSILNLADEAAGLGIELFVLDDGWFGKRDDDNSSLGDWYPHARKLPHGIRNLAEKIIEKGLLFGLWFEPEMVSEDSDLYRAHPEWCLQVKDRSLSTGRNQLILDYSRKDVRDYIVSTMSAFLRENPISYIKWDMNRHMTEVGSLQLLHDRQRETAHRYILGLYEVLEIITSSFPNILFESCSGGGGRFDPGMLYYMPQTWGSDNTDALSRLLIQEGTTLVYPPICMGSHVSGIPNHQTGREISLQTRGAVAMEGNLGYELNLLTLSKEEKDEIKNQIKRYKQSRHLFLDGNFYRLSSSLERNKEYFSWQFVSLDKKESIAVWISTRIESNHPYQSVKLKGLDSEKNYCINDSKSYGGDELMEAGLNLPYPLKENTAYEFFIKSV